MLIIIHQALEHHIEELLAKATRGTDMASLNSNSVCLSIHELDIALETSSTLMLLQIPLHFNSAVDLPYVHKQEMVFTMK